MTELNELGIIGVSLAIANVVDGLTGISARDLPIGCGRPLHNSLAARI